MSRRALSLERRKARAAWWFLAPALVLLLLFFVIPVGARLLLSLTDFDVYAIGSPETDRPTGIDIPGRPARLTAMV